MSGLFCFLVMNRYFIYIIYSVSHNVYYKGFSEDVERRLQFHNDNRSKYTSNKGPWVLVYTESFENKTEALKREKILKKQNRKYIEWLISQNAKHV